jgi:hypothetical protein
MGLLVNVDSDERVLLRAHHVFGRSEARADTCIAAPEVSLMHAVVRWRDGAWSVADFSRNGTLVDGVALQPGRWLLLRQQHELRFGRSAGCVWRVCDLSPPGTSLVPVDARKEPIALTGNQLLPHPDAPELAIFQDAAGSWLLDCDDQISRLSPGDAVTLAGIRYRFMVSERIDETADAAASAGMPLQLRFVVSVDEERVQLFVRQGHRVFELGERSHHYCLLTLARRRLRDAGTGVVPNRQGWFECEELAQMLKISITNLNIQIYRARQQLLSCAPAAAHLADIVERSRGRLRLGDFQFEIARDVPTETDVGALRPPPEPGERPGFHSPSEVSSPAAASDEPPPSAAPASPDSGIVVMTGGTGSGRLGTTCGRGLSGGGSDSPLP